jgi:anhydro-N-acetylmuramic acid kinase
MQSKSDKKLFIGIMSGTSSDGLDVALCSIDDNQIKIIDSISQTYSKKLQIEIIELNSPSFDDLNKSNILGNKISDISIKLVNQLLSMYQNIFIAFKLETNFYWQIAHK